MDPLKPKKVLCPNCKGNGYVKLPQQMPNKAQVAQCMACNSNGEMDEDKINSIYVDADGIHRVQ
jgi:DnaJ-class molecular chaperone